MYDLKQDSSEQNNLLSGEPDRAQKLRQAVDRMQQQSTVSLSAYFDGEKDDKWEEKLKSLGYLK